MCSGIYSEKISESYMKEEEYLKKYVDLARELRKDV